MRINKLKLKNFRCFETLELDINPGYTVLVGINGAGKSTILDALSVALGGYLAGFDGIRSNYILSEDAHYKMHMAGSRVDVQQQFPVEVEVEGILQEGKEPVVWKRELNGVGRRTTHGNARTIVMYAKKMQQKVRSGEMQCVLPLVAYYGTGRLWMQKKNRKNISSKEVRLNRQMGYIDCLDVASNEKQMMQWFEEMTYIQLQDGKPVPELEAVKSALRQCYLSVDQTVTDAGFGFNVKNRELEITIYRGKSVEKLPVKMLSDGEKGIISLVADIAYRMALLNPGMFCDVLKTPGVVLIDEIDMHLHPQWQKKIIGDLITIFSNVQFVVTTHSPSVLVNVEKEHIRILDHYQVYYPQNTTYGREVEEVLREIMQIDVRPDKIIELEKKFDNAIDEEEFEEAKRYLIEMREILGDNAREIIENQITLDVEMQG